MSIKTRLGYLERAIKGSDPSGPYICKACGRDQALVFAIIAPGEKPDWPRCEHCPPPRGRMHIVIEDGPAPVLPPPPVREVDGTIRSGGE